MTGPPAFSRQVSTYERFGAEGAGRRRNCSGRARCRRSPQIRHRSRQGEPRSGLRSGAFAKSRILPPPEAPRRSPKEVVLTSIIEVKVPDIGDFKDVPIIEISVKPGDIVKLDDPLITLEFRQGVDGGPFTVRRHGQRDLGNRRPASGRSSLCPAGKRRKGVTGSSWRWRCSNRKNPVKSARRCHWRRAGGRQQRSACQSRRSSHGA